MVDVPASLDDDPVASYIPNWSTACPDWKRRILEGDSLIPFPPLFPDEADAALRVFKQLKIVDAIGSPTIGASCQPWVFDFCNAVFGSFDRLSGRRLIRNFFLLVSKKNSKSTIAAGIMLTALIRNWRKSAEFLILAPTIEVAQNSFKPASDMIRANERLLKIFHIQDHTRTITHREMGATLKVVAADNDTVSGKKAVGVLIDELWLLGKRNNAENMLREATGGLASRPEGFVINLTTQSDDPPAGVFRQRLDYARAVRDGKIDDKRFLPVMYEFPREMIEQGAHKSPENFYIPNPNLGVSVDTEFLISEFKQAEIGGDESLRGFLAKHLNVEIGIALRPDRWAGAGFWESAGDSSLTLERIMEDSDAIVAGIDGGGLDDLLSLSLIGRHRQTRQWMHWHHSWVHNVVLEVKHRNEAPRLRDFVKQGDLTLVDDMIDAFGDLAARVARVYQYGKLTNIGLDPFGVGLIIDAIADEGLPTEAPFMVGVSQGYQLQGAIKTCEVKLASGEFTHGASPIMAWAVGNAKTEQKGNALAITKQQAGAGKIDPLMATFDAVALMSKNPEAKRKPTYEIQIF